ncbi:S8 family peptidase [Longirhabdus pacifica]|uniref:S8 family peptidase n=1 Tax=Longirhabdus pacifica TaxID=2305227 RepID=UPI001008B7F4|nr:S8 family peptidase [Longirhabdus pacifica]
MKKSGLIIGIGVVVLFSFFLFMDRDQDENTVEEERYLKQLIVEKDKEMTIQMSTLQYQKSLQTLMYDFDQNNEGKTNISKKITNFKKTNPNVKQIIALKNDSLTTRPYINSTAPSSSPLLNSRELQPYIKQARQALARKERYASPIVPIDQSDCMVIGMPGTNYSLIGLINFQTGSEVETHQNKNLKLKEFPQDNQYNIQSADGETLERKKVDSAEENKGVSHFHKQEIVVKFASTISQNELEKMKQDIQATTAKKIGYTYVFQSKTMEMEQLKSYFENNWDILYTEPHYLYITNFGFNKKSTPTDDYEPSNTKTNPENIPNDALFDSYQWNLPIINTIEGWNYSKGSEEIKVAVIDTGVDLNHSDLQGKLLEGKNVLNENQQPSDEVGHGTHVAGIISSLVNNEEGIAGMSWYNKIMPVKVLDDSGMGSSYDVAAGIIWAVDNGARVINMSLGNYAQSEFLADAVQYAYEKNVVLVAATGNDSTEQPGYPAAYPQVLAVSATNEQKNRAVFSNFGDYVDITAPGENIPSTYPGNQYASLSGTSMASPHVTALAAMILSNRPDLTNEEVMNIIRQSCDDLGSEGKDKDFGYGQINVNRALEYASSHP